MSFLEQDCSDWKLEDNGRSFWRVWNLERSARSDKTVTLVPLWVDCRFEFGVFCCIYNFHCDLAWEYSALWVGGRTGFQRYFSAEFGAEASLAGEGQLVVKGRFTGKQVETLLRKSAAYLLWSCRTFFVIPVILVDFSSLPSHRMASKCNLQAQQKHFGSIGRLAAHNPLRRTHPDFSDMGFRPVQSVS